MPKRLNSNMSMQDFTFEEEPFVPAEQDAWPCRDRSLVQNKVSMWCKRGSLVVSQVGGWEGEGWMKMMWRKIRDGVIGYQCMVESEWADP